jgi:crotonobetainyl-CoA:carnitine CoA-transferase CaiB-like acyl-CoA transferase
MLLAALLAALLKKQRTGEGSYLDISMTDAVVSLQAMSLADFQVNRTEPERGNTPLSGGLPNYNVYVCNDKKWIALGSLEPKFWEPFCHKVNQENWISAPFLPAAERQRVIAEVQAMFQQKSQKEWLDFFSDMDICLSPVKNMQEVLEQQQLRNNQRAQSHLVDGKQELTTLQFPVTFPSESKHSRWQAPELGEDSYALLKSIGYDDDQITTLVSKGIIRIA